MNPRFLLEFWDRHKTTRKGQCYGLLVIGGFLGLGAGLEPNDLSPGSRLVYGFAGGIGLGVLLILTMVIPSVYLAFIRQRKEEGRPVTVHKVFLVLYFFPFLTYVTLGSTAFVLNYFFS